MPKGKKNAADAKFARKFGSLSISIYNIPILRACAYAYIYQDTLFCKLYFAKLRFFALFYYKIL